jgi:hypothetical protein
VYDRKRSTRLKVESIPMDGEIAMLHLSFCDSGFACMARSMSKLSVATVSWIIGVLQQSWHVRAATQEEFDLGGVLWTPSLNFRGENPRSELHWLYLAVADNLSPC